MHEQVRDVLLKILSQEHAIQNDIFNMMHERGLYPILYLGAAEKKVQETKTKYAQSVKGI
ncbi:MAG: spore coat protein [Lachnospiraceae bacterium]|nr:spore coat protein [Lachnospiraceae bacterium]